MLKKSFFILFFILVFNIQFFNVFSYSDDSHCDDNITKIKNSIYAKINSLNEAPLNKRDKYTLMKKYFFISNVNKSKYIIKQDVVERAKGYELIIYSYDRDSIDYIYYLDGVNSTEQHINLDEYGMYIIGVRAYNDFGCSVQRLSTDDNESMVQTDDDNVTSGWIIYTILNRPEINLITN